MYELNYLNKSNMREFKKLNELRINFNNINKDFFCIYNKKNPVQKFLQKREIRLLKKDCNYIGYIWFSNIRNCNYKINSIIINSNDINEYTMLINSLRNFSKLYYDCQENNYNYDILKKLGFKTEGCVLEMCIDLNTSSEKLVFNNNANISFKKVVKGVDEEIRCNIQNEIFQSYDRIPLDSNDIYYDEIQKYYFDEGAILFKKDDEYIGYGQIIIKNNQCYIVNFGIINEYRNKGYSKILLAYLLNIIKRNSYDKAYINVDSNNSVAVNLYKSFGFKTQFKTCKFILTQA